MSNDAERIERLQINALRIVEYTLQTMLNDMNVLIAGEHTPGSCTFTPNSISAIMPEGDEFMVGCRQAFFDTCSNDEVAMNALADVTAKIVRDWKAGA